MSTFATAWTDQLQQLLRQALLSTEATHHTRPPCKQPPFPPTTQRFLVQKRIVNRNEIHGLLGELGNIATESKPSWQNAIILDIFTAPWEGAESWYDHGFPFSLQ
ncbi:hypothetical protein V6N11_060205 [Hibiscus sabdariffa]|uniref:Uncharacterized protein n=1 Tax=Hibiscus sabdariffa TaxID=183260 RepID=A0ABR1Z851_9ROSI